MLSAFDIQYLLKGVKAMEQGVETGNVGHVSYCLSLINDYFHEHSDGYDERCNHVLQAIDRCTGNELGPEIIQQHLYLKSLLCDLLLERALELEKNEKGSENARREAKRHQKDKDALMIEPVLTQAVDFADLQIILIPQAQSFKRETLKVCCSCTYYSR